VKRIIFLSIFSLVTALLQAANPTVILQTTKGALVIELYPDKAPKTVKNFLDYVNSGFYNGTVFHRVIPGFMIQGGGYTQNLQKKETAPSIPNEAANGLSNLRGTIAMARTDDPHSATSQFFINVADNTRLDHTGKTSARTWGYCVFGKVIKGIEVADAIVSVRTGAQGEFPKDVPLTPILIKKATVEKGKPAVSKK